MPNGRSNGSQVKLLKRVTLMMAAAHRENQRRFAENERRFAENEKRSAENERRFAQNERILTEMRAEFVEWRNRSGEQLAELKKITTIHARAIEELKDQGAEFKKISTIHSKAIIKLLSR